MTANSTPYRVGTMTLADDHYPDRPGGPLGQGTEVVGEAVNAYQRMQGRNADAAAALAARHTVTPVHLRALLVLAARGPMDATRLGAAVGLSSGAVTPLVDRLERYKHAERRTTPADRRKVVVAAVPAGLEIVADVHASYARVFTLAFPERMDDAVTVFTALGDALEKEVASW